MPLLQNYLLNTSAALNTLSRKLLANLPLTIY
jgi:hypothetical protein